MKHVVYYCPGCRHRVTRTIPVSRRKYSSFCATADRVISMIRIKDQAAALKKQHDVIEL